MSETSDFDKDGWCPLCGVKAPNHQPDCNLGVLEARLGEAEAMLAHCDSILSLLWHRYKSQIDWQEWVGKSDMEMQMFMGQLRAYFAAHPEGAA